MTDEQIIKALECCTSQDGSYPCTDCPCWDDDKSDCNGLDWKDVVSLINRQKAEIEELQGTLKFVRGTVARLLETSDKQQAKIEKLKEAYAVYEETTGLKQVRSEAIREFAERLKAKEAVHFCKCGQPFVYTDLFNGEIDNLVKEMTEETT